MYQYAIMIQNHSPFCVYFHVSNCRADRTSVFSAIGRPAWKQKIACRPPKLEIRHYNFISWNGRYTQGKKKVPVVCRYGRFLKRRFFAHSASTAFFAGNETIFFQKVWILRGFWYINRWDPVKIVIYSNFWNLNDARHRHLRKSGTLIKNRDFDIGT